MDFFSYKRSKKLFHLHPPRCPSFRLPCKCKLPLAHPRVLSIVSKAYTRSGQSERPRSACANQNATFQLRQSGRMSGRKANYDTRRASRLHTHASRIHMLKAVSFHHKFLSPLFIFGQRAILFLGSTASHFMFHIV